MAPACRSGTAAAATLVVAVTVWLALRGLARIPLAGAAPGPAAPLVGPRVRAWYRGLLAPLEGALVEARVHPDAVTWAQLAVSMLAGAAFWAGWLFVGGWLTIVAGTLDVLDGGVARDRKIGGPLLSVAAYLMKHPPRQLTDDLAKERVEAFLRGEVER